jgi:hypothetical protein
MAPLITTERPSLHPAPRFLSTKTLESAIPGRHMASMDGTLAERLSTTAAIEYVCQKHAPSALPKPSTFSRTIVPCQRPRRRTPQRKRRWIWYTPCSTPPRPHPSPSSASPNLRPSKHWPTFSATQWTQPNLRGCPHPRRHQGPFLPGLRGWLALNSQQNNHRPLTASLPTPTIPYASGTRSARKQTTHPR